MELWNFLKHLLLVVAIVIVIVIIWYGFQKKEKAQPDFKPTDKPVAKTITRKPHVKKRPNIGLNIEPVLTAPPREIEILTNAERFLFEEIEEPRIIFLEVNDENVFHQILMDIAEQQDNHSKRTLQQIRDESATKMEVAENYINERITHKKDTQNVHDSGINKNLRAISEKLKLDFTQDQIDAAVNEILAKSGKKNVSTVLNAMSQNLMFEPLNVREQQILAAAWYRSKDVRNAPNIDKMQENIIDALVDSVENGKPVCVSGRVGRIIQALTFCDFEIQPESLKTVETYKNEIYQRVSKMLEDKLVALSRSPDENDRLFAETYINPQLSAPPDVELRVKNELYDEISTMISEYNGKINETELDKIKNESYMAIV